MNISDSDRPEVPDGSLPFSLPGPAAKHFEDAAEELLLKLAPVLPDSVPPGAIRMPTSAAHEVSMASFDETNMTMQGMTKTDQFGVDHARGFPVKGGYVGLEGESFNEAAKLCKKLAAKKEICAQLSERFVTDAFFDWMRDRYSGALSSEVSFLRALFAAAQGAVKTRKIAYPIAHLIIQQPFLLGKVLFEFFTTETFDILDKHRPKQCLPETPEEKESTKHTRQRYQGVVCCSMVVRAELGRCLEIARRETDRALAVLRCFSSSAFAPQFPCYFDRRGMALVPGYDYIVFEYVRDEADPPDARARLWPARTGEGTDEKRDYRTVLSVRDLQEVGPVFNNAHILLNREAPTDLEEQLLTCYMLFSRAIRSTTFHERVIYCLISLEALLLKSNNEPIGANMGNRVAFLACRSKDERRHAKELIGRAYDIRSRYLHHGEETSGNMDVLSKLQHLVWDALKNVFGRIAKGCQTRDELLEQLENELMS